MVRRLVAVGIALLFVSAGAMASPASAQEFPPHGHLLLIGADVEWVEPEPGQPPYRIHGFERCVELANARPLPLRAHHERVHFGRAGQALIAAGHQVVPLSPLFPGINSCDDLAANLPFPPAP
jgi:hypothetical protein